MCTGGCDWKRADKESAIRRLNDQQPEKHLRMGVGLGGFEL